jgi:NADH:ubiquinone oxidoreductase subunit
MTLGKAEVPKIPKGWHSLWDATVREIPKSKRVTTCQKHLVPDQDEDKKKEPGQYGGRTRDLGVA